MSCSWSTIFSIFDLWNRSGDIRNQNRKLREIAQDFGCFSLFQSLGCKPSKNCTHVITPGALHVVWIKICDRIPINPALNFKPVSRKCALRWVDIHVNNFFVCGPMFTNILAQPGRGRSWSNTFSMFDLWIRSGDIGDKNRKLSDIAPDFGRFFVLPSFREQPFQKVYPRYHSWLATRHLDIKIVIISALVPNLLACAR